MARQLYPVLAMDGPELAGYKFLMPRLRRIKALVSNSTTHRSGVRMLAVGAIGFAAGFSPGDAAMHRAWSMAESTRPAIVAGSVEATLAVRTAFELHALVQRAWRHQLLVQAFTNFGVGATVAAPVVAAVERQAGRIDMDPLLVAAVIAYENPELEPGAVSVAGALGIMQVMPQWLRSFRDVCGGDLLSIETNVCYGVRILQEHIADARGSVERGLLAYVGCVRDAACRRYPALVMQRRVALYELAVAP